jgi:transposase
VGPAALTGYDYRRCRAYLHSRGIKVRIARRGTKDKSKLGRVRWVVERTISWLLRFKRLGLRYDRTNSPHSRCSPSRAPSSTPAD